MSKPWLEIGTDVIHKLLWPDEGAGWNIVVLLPK